MELSHVQLLADAILSGFRDMSVSMILAGILIALSKPPK